MIQGANSVIVLVSVLVCNLNIQNAAVGNDLTPITNGTKLAFVFRLVINPNSLRTESKRPLFILVIDSFIYFIRLSLHL